MGSYDPQPDDWNDFADIPWAPPHAIFCRAIWAGQQDGKHSHQHVDEVRACYKAMHDTKAGIQVWPCSWLLEGRYDDGSIYTYECLAPARFTPERGEGAFECSNGHDFIPPQVRYAEGWDYAEDAEEAAHLRKHGIDAVSMRGDSI